MTISPLLEPAGRRRAWRAAPSRRITATRLREQRALAEGAGLVDRSDRDVVAVPGADRLTWLHSLTSQHLERLADGDRHRGAACCRRTGTSSTTWCSPTSAGTTWADVEPGAGAALVDFLQNGCASCSASSRRW